MKLTRTPKKVHRPKVIFDGRATLGITHGSRAMTLSVADDNYHYELTIPADELLRAAGWAITDQELMMRGEK